MAKRPDATLVDGHNLLHRWPRSRQLISDDPEAARLLLERQLQGRRRLWLFYDGGPGGRPDQRERHGLQIVYSGRGSADDSIVRWLQNHPRQRALVVTDDATLRGRCRAHGARVQDLHSFMSTFLSGRRDDRAEEPDRGPPPPHEVDEWLRLFGEEP